MPGKPGYAKLALNLTLVTLVAAGSSLTSAGSAASDTARINRLIQKLRPGDVAPTPEFATPTARDRQIIIPVVPGEAPARVRVIIIDPRRATRLSVTFAKNSAELSAEARDRLYGLGAALASPELAGARYLISGHTDASGSAELNQRLSERRAMAVRRYLIESHAIAGDRLVAVGFGEERPIDRRHPRARVNRRVEIALIAHETVRSGGYHRLP